MPAGRRSLDTYLVSGLSRLIGFSLTNSEVVLCVIEADVRGNMRCAQMTVGPQATFGGLACQDQACTLKLLW
jgi:hypothetical protein